MNESKAAMYGSYLALFRFASVMILLQLFFDSKAGAVLWGLVAWQIYRRNKSTLIITLRLLFWLVIVGGIGSIIWLALDPLGVNLKQFVEAEGFGLAISAGLFWWLRFYFGKSPTAADIFSARIAGTQAPAGADIATVESPSPEPQAGNILTRVFARAKQVMSWRRRPPQPAFVGNPPATAGDVADSGGVTHTVTLVATETADTAPPPLAVPKPVAGPPDIKAELGDFPKTVPPENHSTIPLQTIVGEERVYAAIARELETGGTDKGLWTRLFAECDGDERRTKVLYIRQRAERLISAERVRRPK